MGNTTTLASGTNDNYDFILAMRIYILALNEVFDAGLSTFLNTFGIANELAESTGISSTRFDTTVVGVRPRARISQGLSVPVRPTTQFPPPDIALVPAIGAKTPDTLRALIGRKIGRGVRELHTRE